MRDDFVAVIISHGRADRVITYDMMRRSGYTGPILIVIDDEDPEAQQYLDRYGDQVVMFSKSEASELFDEGDNFAAGSEEEARTLRRGAVYARNAIWGLVRSAGYRYFIVLDDDYTSIGYRFDDEGKPNWHRCVNMDAVLEIFLRYLTSTPSLRCICFGQGGDYIGGLSAGSMSSIKTSRKAMNSFICDVERPFSFFGRINEDVNMYVRLGHVGDLFLTALGFSLNQVPTQTNAKGMTDVYLKLGTYVKSFYTVMYAPSCARVTELNSRSHRRLHHEISWGAAVPKILREEHRRPR